MKDLDDAQKVVEMGNALEPVLRQRIEELEDERKDLMVSAFCLLLYMVMLILSTTVATHS